VISMKYSSQLGLVIVLHWKLDVGN
jgi:hypothetical protein